MKLMEKLNNYRSIKLSVYFAILMSAIIIVVTTLFTSYMMFNIKNLASAYESDIYKLRYSISTMLVQSVMLDSERKEFSSTENMIDLLKKENLLTYAFVKNNINNKIIFGEDFATNPTSLGTDTGEIQNLSKDIGDYTVFFGIQTKSNMSQYFMGFFKVMLNIMFIVILLGIIASIFMANLLSKPLQKLSSAAKEIAKSNFNTKIEESTFSEINDLIFSYNEMGSQLKELYTSLEQKVQERTLALEEANYKLQETQAMMVHSEKMRSLGELVAGIAHEINNPVNFIHGNIMI